MPETKPAAPSQIERPNGPKHPDITKFVSGAHKRNVWVQDIPALHTIDDLLTPAYWVHVAQRLTERDMIECWWEDGSRYAVLRVLKKTRTSAHVYLESEHDLQKALDSANIADELARYEVAFNGPGNKYRLVRKADRALIRDGFDTPDAALRWLATEYIGTPASLTDKKAA